MGSDATPPAGPDRPLCAALSAAEPLMVLVCPLRSFLPSLQLSQIRTETPYLPSGGGQKRGDGRTNRVAPVLA